MPAKNKKVTGFSLDPDVVRRVAALAKAQGVTRSQLVNRLLREALDPEEMMVKAFTNPQIASAFGRAFSAPGMLRQMVEVLGEELRPEQLELFEQVMKDVGARATGEAAEPQPGKKKPPRSR